uniref:Uncharacterized protein LOC102802762 n=1 Tax=Saccoglossus kowalevskii TaxID=10224 RepID=A0ABM0M066_SACKO|nr:PREDICTED: uncharacterized protein LOC102802762 [Saccoglossus kowalevskii]
MISVQEYRRSNAGRTLPIQQRKSEILQHIRNHQVTCIQGETGCGKSTKVPQFIIEEANQIVGTRNNVKVIVTQPRRMAAISLAERVAYEMNENVGDTVGYQIGGESRVSPCTQIIYATTGFVLQKLMHIPSVLEKYTHIILDETHERKIEGDILSLILKLLMGNHRIKIVIMSATLQSNLFASYFIGGAGTAPILVSGRQHQIDFIYIDDLVSKYGDGLEPRDIRALASAWIQFNLVWAEEERKKKESDLHSTNSISTGDLAKTFRRLFTKYFTGKGGREVLSSYMTDISRGVSRTSVRAQLQDGFYELCATLVKMFANRGETILIFLPGITEIYLMWDALSYLERSSASKHLIRLFVLHSQIPRDEQEECFIEPTSSHTHVILATNIAESSLTLPKLRVVIDFGLFRDVRYDDRSCTTQLVTKWYAKASAAHRAGNSQYSDMTVFGHIAVKLPLDMPLCRLVYYGVIFNCPCDAVVMAASLSLQVCPFTLPTILVIKDPIMLMESLQRSSESRAMFDEGEYSEPIMYTNMFHAWLRKRVKATDRQSIQLKMSSFCKENSLIPKRLIEMESAVSLIASRIHPFLPSDSKARDDVAKLLQILNAEADDEDNVLDDEDCAYGVASGVDDDDDVNSVDDGDHCDNDTGACGGGTDDLGGSGGGGSSTTVHGKRYTFGSVLKISDTETIHKKISKGPQGDVFPDQNRFRWPNSRVQRRANVARAPIASTPRHVDALFCSDNILLKVLQVAAFSPNYLIGTRSNKTNQRTKNNIDKVGFDLTKTIVLHDCGEINDLMKTGSKSICDMYIHKMYKPKRYLCGSGASNKLMFLEYENGNSRDATLHNIPPQGHLINQYAAEKMRLDSHNKKEKKSRASTIKEENIKDIVTNLRTPPSQPFQLVWKTLSQVRQIQCKLGDIRNPIGFACELRDIRHLAVAANIKGSGGFSHIDGATVLPPDCDGVLAVILLMVFLPSRFDIKIRFDKCQITAIKFLNVNRKLEKNRPVTFEMFYIVNTIRLMVSDILLMKSNRLREIPSSDIGLWIQYLVNVIQSVKETGRGRFDRKRWCRCWWSVYQDLNESENSSLDDENRNEGDDDDDDDDEEEEDKMEEEVEEDVKEGTNYAAHVHNSIFLEPFNLLPGLAKLWGIDSDNLRKTTVESFHAFKAEQKKK